MRIKITSGISSFELDHLIVTFFLSVVVWSSSKSISSKSGKKGVSVSFTSSPLSPVSSLVQFPSSPLVASVVVENVFSLWNWDSTQDATSCDKKNKKFIAHTWYMRLRPTSPIFSPLRGKKMKNCTSHIEKFGKIQIKYLHIIFI